MAAQRMAATKGCAVYLYCGDATWQTTTRLREVPPGALTWEIYPDPDNPERNNTGGC